MIGRGISDFNSVFILPNWLMDLSLATLRNVFSWKFKLKMSYIIHELLSNIFWWIQFCKILLVPVSNDNFLVHWNYVTWSVHHSASTVIRLYSVTKYRKTRFYNKRRYFVVTTWRRKFLILKWIQNSVMHLY